MHARRVWRRGRTGCWPRPGCGALGCGPKEKLLLEPELLDEKEKAFEDAPDDDVAPNEKPPDTAS